MPGTQKIFYNFCKIPVSNRLRVFYLLLELPSDQENKNGFAAERLWFFGHRVESTLKNFVKHCVTHWHVFIQAKYPRQSALLHRMFSRLLNPSYLLGYSEGR